MQRRRVSLAEALVPFAVRATKSKILKALQGNAIAAQPGNAFKGHVLLLFLRSKNKNKPLSAFFAANAFLGTLRVTTVALCFFCNGNNKHACF